MISRRSLALTPVAGALIPALAAGRKMMLSIHQTTSSGAGYQKSLEGWARAGIRNVELSGTVLDSFLKSDSLDTARKIVSDLGLKVVSGGAPAPDLLVQRPGRPAALETWKKRCEQFQSLGAERIYCPAVIGGKA